MEKVSFESKRVLTEKVKGLNNNDISDFTKNIIIDAADKMEQLVIQAVQNGL